MSNTNKSLSDLLDDQCTSVDLDNLLKDSDAKHSWHRYNAVSAILKGEYSADASVDFCQEISAKIADEPAILAAPKPVQTEIRPMNAEIKRFGGGFAIAASMAFATFFSFQTLQVSNTISPTDDISSQIAQSAGSDINTNSAITIEKSAEQLELEEFNDLYMSLARVSELDSIAPYPTTNVSGAYVKTHRISAEQWQQILQAAAARKAKIEAANKATLEVESSNTVDKE